ncbi:hypothetical protein [Escherichia phage NTNC80A]|uniref:HNH nuclease domain-containing protein n=1 Tax=Escherichia phage NTNC80A TaxID=2970325 RepID=A0A976SPS3_9CAUD|nr:hypothetical protein [Escherichia phage NTNC80A]
MTSDQIKEKIQNNIVVSETGCWLWQKSIATNGYGNICVGKGRNRAVHRVACELYHGVPPTRMDAVHSCDNKACCNPEHLSWGTRSRNEIEAVRRLGKSHKLKLHEAAYIKFSGLPTKELVGMFSVSKDLINRIKRGVLWAHVTKGDLR